MAELSNQGPVLFSGATSVVDVNTVASPPPTKFGQRGTDIDGNVYIYCDFQETFIAGEWAAISSTYLATQITSTTRGWVGVVVGVVSASDRAGWVQVYGIHSAAWATSDSSSGFPAIVAATTDLGTITTDGTSANTIGIQGVLVASSPDTCASTALSTSALAAPCTVILNYPFVSGTQISTS
jgi:hypothetical protein